MSMLELVIPTMLAAGITGGLINSYLTDPAVETPLKWWQHIVVGVGAAFIVPVFLNMISSRLISEIKGDLIDSDILSKLLVLAGTDDGEPLVFLHLGHFCHRRHAEQLFLQRGQRRSGRHR